MQVFPKAPKLQASQAALARQDTIDEGGEVEASPPSRETRLVIEGTAATSVLVPQTATNKDRNLHMEREWQIEMASSRATTSDTYDTGLREQPPTLAQRDLIATVLDLKVDVRLEMQRLQQRIGRIEDLLSELVKRLQHPDSSNQTTPGDETASNLLSRHPTNITNTTTTTTTAATATTTQSSDTIITISMTPPTTSTTNKSGLLHTPTGTSGGNGLGTIMLKKRRSKTRKAPAPPKQLTGLITPTQVEGSRSEELEPEQTTIVAIPVCDDTTTTTATPTTCVVTTASGSDVDTVVRRSKREFL